MIKEEITVSGWEIINAAVSGIMRFHKYLFAFLVTSCLFWGQPYAYGDIYSCPDKNGTIHFTNTPVSQNCQIMNLKGRQHSPRYERGVRKKFGRGSSQSYDSYIKKVGNRYNVDPHLIKAVIKTESGFNRYAVSKRGAKGLMQLMPATAKELRVGDPFDPKENIDGGTRYLRKLLDIFNGNLGLTLAAYNAGPTRVKKNNKIPRIPETVNYVRKVLRYYKAYKRGGVGDTSGSPVIRIGEMTLATHDPRVEIL